MSAQASTASQVALQSSMPELTPQAVMKIVSATRVPLAELLGRPTGLLEVLSALNKVTCEMGISSIPRIKTIGSLSKSDSKTCFAGLLGLSHAGQAHPYESCPHCLSFLLYNKTALNAGDALSLFTAYAGSNFNSACVVKKEKVVVGSFCRYRESCTIVECFYRHPDGHTCPPPCRNVETCADRSCKRGHKSCRSNIVPHRLPAPIKKTRAEVAKPVEKRSAPVRKGIKPDAKKTFDKNKKPAAVVAAPVADQKPVSFDAAAVKKRTVPLRGAAKAKAAARAKSTKASEPVAFVPERKPADWQDVKLEPINLDWAEEADDDVYADSQ